MTKTNFKINKIIQKYMKKIYIPQKKFIVKEKFKKYKNKISLNQNIGLNLIVMKN